MNITQLIAQYEFINSKIVDEIKGASDEEVIRKLDSIACETSSIIAQVHLTKPLEINKQVKFFMNRSKSVSGQSASETDLMIVEHLIDRYTNRASVDPLESDAISVPSCSSPFKSLIDTPLLRKQIEASNSRTSLFNLDYNFEQTSVGNAAFHETTPSELNNKALVNIVGETRFVFRAKAYLDRAFSGRSQKYSYFLDVPEKGERLLSCELNPVHDSDGSVRGALFEIVDITDRVFDLSHGNLSADGSNSGHSRLN